MDRDSPQISATILASGLVIAALLVAGAIGNATGPDRTLEISGVAEREVRADLAVWPIRYAVGADGLEALRAGIDGSDEAVIAFLKLNGFSDEEIDPVPPGVTDRHLHGSPGDASSPRFVAKRTIMLRSTKVDAVRQAMGEAAELIGQGVSLGPEPGARARFLFTGLDDIRPAMISQAGADAHRAARRFAEDTGSGVGAVLRASQGSVSIIERDPASPHIKLVRVVTTIEYALN